MEVSALCKTIFENVRLNFKSCTNCEKEKQLCEYYKDKSKSQGVQSSCIECLKEKRKNKPKKKPVIVVEDVKKVCKGCDKEKLLTEFYKDAGSLDGVKSKCKICCEEAKKIWKENNKEKIKQQMKEYGQRPEVQERVKKYREDNKEKLDEARKEYNEINKEILAEKSKEYRAANREKISAAAKERLKNDEQARLAHNLRARFHDALKRADVIKTESTFDLIGCSAPDLKLFIEGKFLEGMTWDNYGSDRNGTVKNFWHIDHIKPVAVFDLTKEDQRKECFHFNNLQPLWAKDNWNKGKKYVETENITKI